MLGQEQLEAFMLLIRIEQRMLDKIFNDEEMEKFSKMLREFLGSDF